MSEIKLKNCPFCGGEAEVLKFDNGFNIWFQVVCKTCNVSQTGSDNWTFCSKKDCKHKECYLHQSNIRNIWENRSVADYESTKYCEQALAEMGGE